MHQPTSMASSLDTCSAMHGLKQEMVEVPQQQIPVARNVDITASNTTLIGDYTSVVFTAMDSKWLVQAQGNAMFASTLALIKDHMLITDRRYVFFQLGGNQVCSSDRNKLFSQILDIVVTVRESNPLLHIFFIGVLPRIVDNEDIKPFIVRFNRWLASVVNEVNIVFERVRFLPVQLHFLVGT